MTFSSLLKMCRVYLAKHPPTSSIVAGLGPTNCLDRHANSFPVCKMSTVTESTPDSLALEIRPLSHTKGGGVVKGRSPGSK